MNATMFVRSLLIHSPPNDLLSNLNFLCVHCKRLLRRDESNKFVVYNHTGIGSEKHSLICMNNKKTHNTDCLKNLYDTFIDKVRKFSYKNKVDS